MLRMRCGAFKGIILQLVFSLFSICATAQNNLASRVSTYASIYDSLFSANDWRQNFGEKFDKLYGDDWRKKMLKVGDNLAALQVGQYLYDTSKIYHFNQFKGKLLILDFWSINCASCIEFFPKLARLQQEFGDKIQVLLVNPFDKYEDIIRRFPQKAAFHELPILVNSMHLFPLFPTGMVPYHVWIDTLGTILGMGSSLNTNKKKIRSYLNGGNISFLGTESTNPGFVPEIPYHKILEQKINPNIYNSYFSNFNTRYATSIPGVALKIHDSNSKTIRNTFINQTIVELILNAWDSAFRMNNYNEIYSPNLFQIIFRGIDTLSYTDYFVKWHEATDESYTQSRYCYEQIFPEPIMPFDEKSKMQEDINNHILSSLGDTAIVKDSIIEVNIISKSSFSSQRGKKVFKKESLRSKDAQYILCENLSFKEAILRSIKCPEKIVGIRGCYLIDATGEQFVKKIYLPISPTIVSLKETLKMQGYQLFSKRMPMTFLIVQKKAVFK